MPDIFRRPTPYNISQYSRTRVTGARIPVRGGYFETTPSSEQIKVPRRKEQLMPLQAAVKAPEPPTKPPTKPKPAKQKVCDIAYKYEDKYVWNAQTQKYDHYRRRVPYYTN